MSPYKWHKRLEQNRQQNHESGIAVQKIGPRARAYADQLIRMAELAKESSKNRPRRPWDYVDDLDGE